MVRVEIETIIKELTEKGWSCSRIIDQDDLIHMNRFFDSKSSEFKDALIGRAGNKVIDKNIRGDKTFWLDPLNLPAPFLSINEFLEELRLSLNRTMYLGMKEFECHLACYPVGASYQTHTDRFEKTSSRMLSFVFYLNTNWDDSDGGELVLYDSNKNVIETILPQSGFMVCFLSEDFPHEVKPSKQPRRSLTGWFHNKILN